MILMAMDRASVRKVDGNGYMHVEVSNISKANVCPYYGREIPNWEALGLDPDHVYQLYRDPEELAKGAETFNNVPLLSEHLPVLPDNLPDELIIGSTGTDAMFAPPYLRNSLVVWCGEHQRGIDEHRKKELSSGYRYRADMTPGRTSDGFEYDGVMRDIIGNHVALVFEGRAGPDVVVGDEVMKLKSRTALMVSGAVSAIVRPLLAKDAKVDLSGVLSDVNAASLGMDGAPKKLAGSVATLVKPHLAADASIDEAILTAAISAVQPLALDEDEIDDKDKPAEDEDPDADEDKKTAEGESPDDDDKPAMDSAAVRQMISDAEKRGAQRAAAIDVAKRDVAPLVGETIGHDSAESIYRFALDSAGYAAAALKDAPLSTLKAMVEREASKKQPMAQDRKYTATSKLAAIVPNLPPMIRS